MFKSQPDVMMNNIIESFVFYRTPIRLRFSEYTKMHEKGMSVKNASSQYDIWNVL